VSAPNCFILLLKRLRRIIAIETDLFAIQAEILHGRRRRRRILPVGIFRRVNLQICRAPAAFDGVRRDSD
jgi:hypothetical protein